MVRFKNRHILVEFLQPSLLKPGFQSAGTLPLPSSDEDEDLADDDDDVLHQIPEIPFMLPLAPSETASGGLKLGDDGSSTIYKAIRAVVQDVYGDEGWGRISSSFRVIYHSPLTTLTILRISRSHYRLLWSAITLLSSLNGQSVLPRVIAVSGTIKKLQNAAIVYHRNITARVLAVALNGKPSAIDREEETKRLEGPWGAERAQITSLED